MAVAVMTPKPWWAALAGAPGNAAPARMFPLGAAHTGWLNTLKASTRNWMPWSLCRRKRFATAMLIDWRGGVVIELRPTFPNWPSGDKTNDAGSYHRPGEGSAT